MALAWFFWHFYAGVLSCLLTIVEWSGVIEERGSISLLFTFPSGMLLLCRRLSFVQLLRLRLV